MLNNSKNVRTGIKYIAMNITTLIAGFMLSYIIPKFITIEDYGNYKFFLMLLPYLSLLHFGFVDGIYLAFRKKNIEEEHELFSSGLLFLFIIRIITSLVVVIFISKIVSDNLIKLSFYFAIMTSFITNMIAYFDYVFQATGNFSESGFLKVGTKLIQFSGVIVFAFVNVLNFRSLLIINLISNTIVIIISLFITLKQIRLKFKWNLVGNLSHIKNGFFLMIGNVLISLLLTVDKIIIKTFYDISTFAMYSFATTITLIIHQLSSTVGSLIYTYISDEGIGNGNLIIKFETLLILLTTFCLNVLFFNKFIIERFLPNYIVSISYLNLLVFSIFMLVIIQTLHSSIYKVKSLIRPYSIINIIIFITAVLTNLLALAFIGTIESIIIATNLTFFIWYLINLLVLSRLLKTQYLSIKNLSLIIISSILYSVVVYNYSLFYIICFNIYACVLVIINRNIILSTFR